MQSKAGLSQGAATRYNGMCNPKSPEYSTSGTESVRSTTSSWAWHGTELLHAMGALRICDITAYRIAGRSSQCQSPKAL